MEFTITELNQLTEWYNSTIDAGFNSKEDDKLVHKIRQALGKREMKIFKKKVNFQIKKNNLYLQ